MPLAMIRAVGDGLYYIHYLDQRADPDYGQGGGFHPDHDLPGRPVRPDNSLPGMPPHVSNRPPMNPALPDHTLPSTPPPSLAPGQTLVLVRGPDGHWRYAAIPAGQPVPTPLPVPPPTAQPKM